MINTTHLLDIKRLLDSLLIEIQKVLGPKLQGLYLYGSLIWGDFDYGVSDIDLAAVTTDDVTKAEFGELKLMHDEFARAHPIWDNQIEVQYVSESGLRAFREKSSKMAVISPGEPFHVIDAGIEWLTNWYFVQDYGLTLFGPAPSQFISAITKDEFIQAIYDHALFWKEHVKQTRDSRPYQSYAVLTLCRALYTVVHREQVSKHKAAEWAATRYPIWAEFIKEALYVRSHVDETRADAERAYPQTEQFVLDAIEGIKKLRG